MSQVLINTDSMIECSLNNITNSKKRTISSTRDVKYIINEFPNHRDVKFSDAKVTREISRDLPSLRR